MNSQTRDTIQLDSQTALGIVNTVLPFLKAAIPAVAAAGGPIGLGIAGAEALIPLIQLIPTSDLQTVAQQQAQLDTVKAISTAGFSGAEWKKSTDGSTASPTTA